MSLPLISRVQPSAIVRLLGLIALTSALPNDCTEGDSTCSLHEPAPAMGEALLQHHAQREQTIRGHAEHEKRKESALQLHMAVSGSDDLPAGAVKLFNEKFCHESNTSKNSNLFNSANSTMSDGKQSASSKKGQKDEAKKSKKSSENSEHNSSNMSTGKEKASFSSLDVSGESETDLTGRTFNEMYFKNFDAGDNSEGVSASLNDEGLKKVVATKSDEEMAIYIRRVAERCDMKIIDDGGLNGAVGWFKSAEADATYDDLKAALFKSLLAESSKHWTAVRNQTGVSAATASLDLVGYVQVRSLRSAKEMRKFVKRMVENMGIKIVNNGGFDGLLQFYSEPDSSGSFQKLMSEIKRATFEHSWAELE